MSLTINAPQVEGKLRQEAAKLGVTAADYAADILASHLGPQDGDPATGAPFYATATPAQWNSAFDEWVDSHPRRTPLPESSLGRESFYEGRA
jgi:hypothetical protein